MFYIHLLPKQHKKIAIPHGYSLSGEGFSCYLDRTTSCEEVWIVSNYTRKPLVIAVLKGLF